MRKQSDEGADYLYHGQTTLIGVHTKDTLQLTQHEQDDLHVVTPEDVFPEYFVIRVNEFDQLAVTPLRMSEEERRVYDHYLDTLVRDTDVMKTKLLEAEIQGHKKGMAEGLKEGKAQGMAQGMAHGKDEANRENAKWMKDKGYSIEDIADFTGLTTEMIEHL